MSRINVSQVSSDSIDVTGLSVVTSSRRINDQRYGIVYDNAHLAAVVPVHFHPVDANNYLMLFNRRWSGAVSSPQTPGAYSDYTEDTSPGWAMITTPSGQRRPVGSDGSYAIPFQHNYDDIFLVDAVSRTSEYLYVLFAGSRKTLVDSQATTVTNGIITHWWNNPSTKSISLLSQEEIPQGVARPDTITAATWDSLSFEEKQSRGLPVVFDKGLQCHTPFMVVYGTDSLNRLYKARKPWSRIGTNLAPRISGTIQGLLAQPREDPRWTYFTGTGWSLDSSEIVSMTDQRNQPITSAGPVSVATHRNQTFLSTVTQQVTSGTPEGWAVEGSENYSDYIPGSPDEDQWISRIYSQRDGRPWAVSGELPLGSTSAGTYLQETVRFQPELLPSSAVLAVAGPNAAIPYIVSTKRFISDVVQLATAENNLSTDSTDTRGTLAEDLTPETFAEITGLANSWGVWPTVTLPSSTVPDPLMRSTDMVAVFEVIASATVTGVDDV